MSFEDDDRPGRGAYTPPTDDDLPFRRNSYDPRSGRNVGSGAGKPPPVTLIVSAVVLLLLIVAVIFFYRSGMRASTDAPPAVGQPVGEMKSAPPIDAQPIDPAEGVRVYRDEGETTDAPVTFTPPPEAPQARPAAPAPRRKRLWNTNRPPGYARASVYDLEVEFAWLGPRQLKRFRRENSCLALLSAWLEKSLAFFTALV